MKKQEKKWYLLRVDGGLKGDVMVTVTPKKLLTSKECLEIITTFDD